MNIVEHFENEKSAGYEQFVEIWIPNYHNFLDQLPKLLSETGNKSLLAVGCGTGNEIERFARSPRVWKITGIEPASGMIRQAREKLKDCRNVTLIEGLLSDLSLDQKYGAATLLLVLHFFEDNGDKLNLLKEISARLMPGAPFVMLDITGVGEEFKNNLRILRLLLPDSLNEEEIRIRLHRIETDLYHVSGERLSELCLEAGFAPPFRFFQSAIYSGWLTQKK